MNYVVTGTADQIIEFIRGPRPAPQHDEHTKGWRWELYLQSQKQAEANLREEVRKMIAEVREREVPAYQLAAE